MATPAELLDGEAFNQLVLEEGLKTWEQEGYVYAGKRGKKGWELYKAYGPKWRWIWSFRQVVTQDNVAGGSLTFILTPPTGQTAKLIDLRLAASGNRALWLGLFDEDSNQTANLATIGATAANTAHLPSIGSVSTASNNVTNSMEVIVGGGATLRGSITSAAQTETATMGCLFICTSATAPSVSWASSGGTPNVADATVDSMTAVLLP